MRNTTNAFDGLQWTLGTDANWSVRTFVTKPVLIEPEKLDSNDKNRFTWGAFFQSRSRLQTQLDAYYFGLHENEQTLTERRFSTLGARLFKRPTAGAFDYEVESAFQFGSQADLELFAHFQHAEIGYVFSGRWTPGLTFQYDYASGDGNPEDETWGRFSTLFGCRRFDFSPTGIYGPFFRENLSTPGIRLVLVPAERFEIMAAHRAFWLAQAKDSWVGSGLRDPSGESGSSVGQQFEVRFLWRAVSFALIELGYAHFFKGSYLDRVPGSPQDTQLELLLRIHRHPSSSSKAVITTENAGTFSIDKVRDPPNLIKYFNYSSINLFQISKRSGTSNHAGSLLPDRACRAAEDAMRKLDT